MQSESFGQLPQMYTASERTIQAAHANPRPTEKNPGSLASEDESRNGEVQTRQYDPRMLQYIAKVTGGDTARLIYNSDGSITIANHPQR